MVELIQSLAQEKEVEANLSRLIGGNFEKEPTDGHITEVALPEVLEVICRMQDHITMTKGFWATDRRSYLRASRTTISCSS